MSWAHYYIKQLLEGKQVSFRPRGNSMLPKIKSGQLVTVTPLGEHELSAGDIVLCRVSGRDYLHLVKAVRPDGQVQIGNNKGHINGWTSRSKVYGLCVRIED